MTDIQVILRRFKHWWMSAWPFWTLAVFASLAVLRFLPGGYIRAITAAPVLLTVPGSLTLGAVFKHRNGPQGTAFVCYATLLSVIWSVMASLGLYRCGILITANSTYWCLFIISAVLAIVAEMRILLGRPGRGHRGISELETIDPDLSDAEANDARRPSAKGGSLYVVIATIAGVSLLVGGVYAYDHNQNPASPGYTWIAWTRLPVNGDIAMDPAGVSLPFQIVHHQSDVTTFRLSATWLGSPSRPLAVPRVLSIGPNQTFRGSLFIPPLSNGCTYRIVVTLAAVRQIDPLTGKLQVWSINADVHDPSRSQKTCK